MACAGLVTVCSYKQMVRNGMMNNRARRPEVLQLLDGSEQYYDARELHEQEVQTDDPEVKEAEVQPNVIITINKGMQIQTGDDEVTSREEVENLKIQLWDREQELMQSAASHELQSDNSQQA